MTAHKRAGSRKPRPGSGSLELVAAKAAGADGKLQQRFRRLLEKVERLRGRARAWKEERANIDRELSVYAALLEQQGQRARELVMLLDRSYTNGGLSKADRKQLAACICSLAADLLEHGGHDDLKPLYNRYSRGDFDAEMATADAADAVVMKAMMELFGVEFGDADVSSMEKLEAFTEAQMQDLDREEVEAQARRAKRKKSAKQVANEARRADEQRSAHKAVQEVYRALAMAWHPDREQDPVERARKAELMREANVAYEARDLLRLLELQLRLERVDATDVEVLAEERVRHYVRILDEQAKQLATELDEMEFPFRMDLGLSPTASLTPSNVIVQIRADAALVRRQIDAFERDLQTFEDPARLKAWLTTRGRSRPRTREPRPFA